MDNNFYEDELDAARAAVNHLGGAKRVGPQLWPDKTPDGAGRYMLDCLNPHRSERLSPSQVLLLMRMAREADFHGLAAYYMRESGYAPPVPVEPQVESAQLARQMREAMERMGQLAERFEKLQGRG